MPSVGTKSKSDYKFSKCRMCVFSVGLNVTRVSVFSENRVAENKLKIENVREFFSKFNTFHERFQIMISCTSHVIVVLNRTGIQILKRV